MKCKILMLLATSMSLFGITQIAIASGFDPQFLSMQNSFYIGADIGIADLMNKESHAVNPESHQLGSIGAVGGGFIGYDFCIANHYRMAIEGFADVTGLKTRIKHASRTYQMKQRYHFGVRLLPEFTFTKNTLGHLILGYVNGHFKINDNGVYGTINANNNRNGFQTGFGISTALINNFFIRIDALYNSYSSHTNQGVGLTGSNSSQFYTNRFSQLAGELSLYYKLT